MAKNEALTGFLKNNKIRREQIALKLGFNSSQDYIDHLSQEPGKNKAKVKGGKKPTIHNVYILDASGSMEQGGKIYNALTGINEEVSQLKKDKSTNYTQTLIDFSGWDDIRIFCLLTPLKDMGYYSTKTRGMTALYQTVGETLERLKKEVDSSEKILVKIFTDGGENNSTGRWKDKKALSSLIKECENRGFTITFVGTDTDVADIVKNINIDVSNTLTHDNTASGVTAAFMCSTNSTMTYSKRVAKGEDVSKGFYSKKIGTL